MAVMVMILNRLSLFIFNSREYDSEKRVEEHNKISFIYSGIGGDAAFTASNLLL